MGIPFNVGEEIIKSTQDVFSTMLMVEVQHEAIVENQRIPIDSHLTSMIGLGGGIRGMLAIHGSTAAATGITSAFLGMDVTEIDDDVKDAIGEIANMVAGNLKVSFAAFKINVELAIPTTIIGSAFTLSSKADAMRIIVPFVMAGNPFWVELIFVIG